MSAPLVFDIKRAATKDGSGIRTVIFFKGCPLDCYWCHNPEGKRAQAELALFRERCDGCGACRRLCKSPDGCTLCGECVRTCHTGARRLYGAKMTEEELLAVILEDLPYYEATGGGVTFSGGECLLYPDTVASLARKCKEKGIHVAVDTAGYVPFSAFETVLPYVDLFLYDIKALDPALHVRGTGKDNASILSNLDALLSRGARVLVRIPVIPGFNDGEELARIRAYCEEKHLPYECLSYHAYGESKREALESVKKSDA